MSYCRSNGIDSNVYVIEHSKGCLVCYCRPFETKSRQEMIDHLVNHSLNGDMVPTSALDRLLFEIGDEGPDIISPYVPNNNIDNEDF